MFQRHDQDPDARSEPNVHGQSRLDSKQRDDVCPPETTRHSRIADEATDAYVKLRCVQIIFARVMFSPVLYRMTLRGEDTNNRSWSIVVARSSLWYSWQGFSVSLPSTLVRGTNDASPLSSGSFATLTLLPHARWCMEKRNHRKVSLTSVAINIVAHSLALPASVKTTFWAGKRCSAWNEKYAAFEVRPEYIIRHQQFNPFGYSPNNSRTCGMAQSASGRKAR